MDDISVRFLYGTAVGRRILKWMMNSRVDRAIVRFLRSRWSRFIIPGYVKRHNVKISREQLHSYKTFRDFFARTRDRVQFDCEAGHLISPCDGWLSAYAINENSEFTIKGKKYRTKDLIGEEISGMNFEGGVCLVFRLCASDFHHFCFIDDGYVLNNHFIPGELHSVQSSACSCYPVYTLNRRSWCMMVTNNFGKVVQTEIGAFVVGGIVNHKENTRVRRGEEKGYFELAGSSIVLLFETNHIRLITGIRREIFKGHEVRVRQGVWIGNRYPVKREALLGGVMEDHE